MSKISILMGGVALLALSSAAYAGQPAPLAKSQPKQTLTLSDRQLDGVNAGGVGIANAGSIAIGEVDAVTYTQTSTNVVTSLPVLGSSTAFGRVAIGQAFTQALAAGGFLYNAAAISHADTQASLP